MKKELKRFDVCWGSYGDNLIDITNGKTVRFVGVSFTETGDRSIIVEDLDGVRYARISDLKIAPLGYIDDLPVYAGDSVYHIYVQKSGVVVGASDKKNIDDIDVKYGNGTFGAQLSNLSWEKPKVKKVGWVNLYMKEGYLNSEIHHRVECRTAPYTTKELANADVESGRIACVKIEWEE